MKKTGILAIILSCVLLLCSCGIKPSDDRTVLVLSGKNINHDYYRYVYMNTAADYEDPGEHGDEIAASALKTLIHNRAIELVAEKYGVKLSSDDKKAVNSWYKEQKASVSDEEWQKNLSLNYLTEYLLVSIQEFNTLWQMIYDYYTDEMNMVIRIDDKGLKDMIPEVFHNVMYVMISSDSENAHEKAVQVKALADSGEDFKKLVLEYGEDENMKSLIDSGYYYVDGEIVPSVEDEVKKLNVGDVSDVIETDLGCFVIKVLDIDGEYVDKHLNTFRTDYFAYMFNKEVAETEKKVTVEKKPLYDEFNAGKAE
ncbi:MAG: peptidylprolyl isomerase [Firmicutes bacterium]|nr:peptidylprolyl isomerase [Candidatus Colimorpha enterica]